MILAIINGCISREKVEVVCWDERLPDLTSQAVSAFLSVAVSVCACLLLNQAHATPPASPATSSTNPSGILRGCPAKSSRTQHVQLTAILQSIETSRTRQVFLARECPDPLWKGRDRPGRRKWGNWCWLWTLLGVYKIPPLHTP